MKKSDKTIVTLYFPSKRIEHYFRSKREAKKWAIKQFGKPGIYRILIHSASGQQFLKIE